MMGSHPTLLLLIALGGALGSVLRFIVGGWFARFATQWSTEMAFPMATLAVNLLGSFCIGIAIIAREQGLRDPGHREFLRGFLIIGLLGGFTTFSTFSLETVQLLVNSFWVKAMLNIIASIITCILAAWAGLSTGRLLIQG